MLKYRVLTAVVALPLLVLIILKLPTNYFSLLLAFITALAAWEWSGLVGFKQRLLRSLYVVMIVAGVYLSFQVTVTWILWSGLVYWCWIFLAILSCGTGIKPLGLQWAPLRILSGVLFLVVGFSAIDIVRQLFGSKWLLLMLVIIMAADTGAYFFGRAFGQRTLAKRISPKKTVEGFLGGLLVVLLVSVSGSYFFHITVHQRILFCSLSIVASVVSVIGDLSVSVMKRQVHLKDTGHLLPGHGGLLDRLDSIFSGMFIFALGFLSL